MGDSLSRKSKQLTAEIENKNVEYLQSLEVPSDVESNFRNVLQIKDDLEADIMSFHLQQLILKELELPQEAIVAENKIEKNIVESKDILSESKAVCDESLSLVKTTNQAIAQAIDRLNVGLHDLSHKISTLENKCASAEYNWQETTDTGSFGNDSPSDQKVKERILFLLEGASEKRGLIEARITRLKYLRQLAENTASCVQSDEECQITLSNLQQKLSALEFWSGIECTIIDDQTIAIHCVDIDTLRLPDDDKLIITLSFESDESQCLELSALTTNIKIPEVETIVESIKNEKDLPKVLRSLRNAWLSYVTLVTEISSLRESHAIDWKSDSRVFHLMIAKYICRFSIPPSYPSGGCVKLEQVMGLEHKSLTFFTEENPPSDASLTGWVKHMETILA